MSKLKFLYKFIFGNIQIFQQSERIEPLLQKWTAFYGSNLHQYKKDWEGEKKKIHYQCTFTQY